ncbi:hypothetical protein CP8484711_1197B, partial [Chlamydia psittaci 84-8471/1]
LYLTNCFVS